MAKAPRFTLRVEDFDGCNARVLPCTDQGHARERFRAELAAGMARPGGVNVQMFDGRNRLAFGRFKMAGFALTVVATSREDA